MFVFQLNVVVLFFFSSRRRHTRFSRDWSSDVCSSDLMLAADVFARIDAMLGTFNPLMLRTGSKPEIEDLLDKAKKRAKSGKGERSEERRVGKEWRARWARDQ